MARLFVKIVLLTAVCSSFFLSDAYGQEEKYISLYIYNFTKHIEWPDEYKGGNFIIDVLGHKSVYDKLSSVLNTKSRGKQQFVVNRPASVEKVHPDCHILFLGHWRSGKLQKALDRVGPTGTLVVTEKQGMLQKGADINLVIRNKKIMYEFNKTNLKKRELSFSTDLSSLAQRVVE